MRSSLHHVKVLFNRPAIRGHLDVNGNHYEKPGVGVEPAAEQHTAENLVLYYSLRASRIACDSGFPLIIVVYA